jgi:hypothetical protein
VKGARLDLTRPQILAFRRHVGALDARLPAGPRSLRRAATVLRERIGAPPPAAVKGELETCLAGLQERLGPEASRGIWDEGAALTPEEVHRLAAAGG